MCILADFWITDIPSCSHIFHLTWCVFIMFDCNVMHVSMYQVCEWGQIHADGDHTAGEAQLAEANISLRKKHGEVEPTAGQHGPCR